MIAIDTSALIAILLEEVEAPRCLAVLDQVDDICIAAPTLTEAMIVALRRSVAPRLEDLFDRLDAEVVPLTPVRARAAGRAYDRYGKSFHAAALNYGDCCSYALAKERGCPLLFVGNDFTLTDVTPA